jgi:hypothetical protein
MSPSRRSESASPSSPASGAADPEGPFREEDPDRAPLETITVDLETSRQRPAGWTVFGIVVGSLLIWKLGTVGVWAGILLVLIGMYRAWELVQTYRHPAGTISVSDKEVVLPRGLHVPRPVRVAPSDVTAVYFLRRAVPMSRAAPVLVVEVGRRAIAYPRDWFASEADQRQVVHALLSHRPPDAAAHAAGERQAGRVDIEPRGPWIEIIGGVVLLAIGVFALAWSHDLDSGSSRLYVAPFIVGVWMILRGINKR